MMTSLLTNRFVNILQGNRIVSLAVLLMLGGVPAMVAPAVWASDDVDVLPGEFSSPAVPSEAQSSSTEAPELAAVRIGAAGPLANLSIGLGRQFKEDVPGANVEISSREVDRALDDVLRGDLDIAAIDRPLTANEQALGLTAIPLGAGLFYVFDDSAPSSRIQPFLNFLDDPANASSIQRAVASVRPEAESTDAFANETEASGADGFDTDSTGDIDDTDTAVADTPDGETDADAESAAEADVGAGADVDADADAAPADSEIPSAALGEAEEVTPVPSNEIPDGRPGGVASQRSFPWWWLLLPLLLGIPLVAWLSRGKKSETGSSSSPSGIGEDGGRGDRPSTTRPAGTSVLSTSPDAENGVGHSTHAGPSTPTDSINAPPTVAAPKASSAAQPTLRQPSSPNTVGDGSPTQAKSPIDGASSTSQSASSDSQGGGKFGKASAGVAFGAAGLAGAMAAGKKSSSEAERPATESPDGTPSQTVADVGKGDAQSPVPLAESKDSDLEESDSQRAQPHQMSSHNGQAVAPSPNGQAIIPPDSPLPSSESVGSASPDVSRPEPMTAVNDSIRSDESVQMDAALPIDSPAVEPFLDSESSSDSAVEHQTVDEQSDESGLGNLGTGAIAAGLGVAGLGLAAARLDATTEDFDSEASTAFAVPPVLHPHPHDDAEGTDASFPLVSIRQFLIQPSDNQEVIVQWEMGEHQQHFFAGQDDEGNASSLQLKIYDVTGIDLDSHPPHDIQLHKVPASAFEGDSAQMTVPVPLGDRDYLAELGHVTGDQWMSLGRSLHTYVPAPSAQVANDDDLNLVMEGAAEPSPAAMPIIITDEEQPTHRFLPLADDESDDESDAVPRDAVAPVESAAASLGVAGLGAMAIARREDDQQKAVTVQEPTALPSAFLTLADNNSQDLHLQWTVPDEQIAALEDAGVLPLKMRLYDVTGIDLNAEPAHDVQVYNLDKHSTELTLSAPQNNRDYLAELGYETPDGQWQQLVRSLHVHVPERSPERSSTGHPESHIPQFAGAPPPSSPSMQTISTQPVAGGYQVLTDLQPFNPASCNQGVTVNAQDHSYVLNDEQVAILQSTAQSATLDSGNYVVTIEEGSFNYWTEHPEFPGEPIALIWLHGGRFINKQTNVETTSTWVSLNGFDDVLTLDVIEPTTLSALFLDTYREDNAGKVTLLILKDD